MMRGFPGPEAGYMMNGNFWFMGIVSTVAHLIFWAIVIYIAYKLFTKYFARRGQIQATPEDAAMNILRERMAKGEIGAEEFEPRRSVLEKIPS